MKFKQAIGDRAGEAATLAQISFSAWERQVLEPAAQLMAASFLLCQEINAADQKVVLRNLTVIASNLHLDQANFDALIRHAA